MFNKIKSLGLGTRIIAVTLTILLTVVAVNYVIFVRGYEHSAHEAMVERAAAFTAVADEAKNHVGKLNNDGVFDTENLLDELQQALAAGKPASDAKIFGTIPVVAGWTAAQEAAARENIDFRVSSFEARNKQNEPAAGSFEEGLLRDLTNQVASGGSEIAYRVNDATNELHYMRAIKLTNECMMCHGVPGNEWDTDKNGIDPIGFPMESWTVGYMHGAYHVVMPLDPVDAQVASFIGNGLVWTVPLVIGAVVLFVVLLRVMFGRPMAALIERVRDIAQGEGDLTKRVAVSSQDEVGQLGKWFNVFVEKIHDVISEVSTTASEVATTSTEVAASSEEMSRGMSDQNQQVTQVSSAIEQMSVSVVEVARKSADAAGSAADAGRAAQEGGQVVTETIEGMNSIRAAVDAGVASVTELGKRGEQIGQIIEVINDIADQTNLLALNAAIEAARAGEHGRGFAVVADEVRKLADRTTKATEEIGDSIMAIQTETTEAVDRMNAGANQVKEGVARATEAGKSLEQIVTSSQEVASMIQSIAAAAEEQSAASEQVSRSIGSIKGIADQATLGATQAAEAVNGLAQRSSQLQAILSQFKLNTDLVGDAAKWSRKSADPVRILLVDDDPSALDLLKHHLADYGDCSLASGGNQAVSSFRSLLDQGHCYDLVCLDIMMPDKDGRKVLTELRAMERQFGVGGRHRSKVVMVSALDTPQDKLKAFREDCDAYLTKPINKGQVFSVAESMGFTARKSGSKAAA